MISRPIILIDDDVDDLELFLDVFASMKIENEVLAFNDGKHALEYITNNSAVPFFILCDINMPRLNGLELRKHLFEIEALRTKTIPFLFLSTGGASRQVQSALI